MTLATRSILASRPIRKGLVGLIRFSCPDVAGFGRAVGTVLIEDRPSGHRLAHNQPVIDRPGFVGAYRVGGEGNPRPHGLSIAGVRRP
jgi:hypothetical protein